MDSCQKQRQKAQKIQKKSKGGNPTKLVFSLLEGGVIINELYRLSWVIFKSFNVILTIILFCKNTFLFLYEKIYILISYFFLVRLSYSSFSITAIAMEIVVFSVEMPVNVGNAFLWIFSEITGDCIQVAVVDVVVIINLALLYEPRDVPLDGGEGELALCGDFFGGLAVVQHLHG